MCKCFYHLFGPVLDYIFTTPVGDHTSVPHLDYYSGHHWTGCGCTPISGTLSDGHAMTGTRCDHASLDGMDMHDSVLCVYSVLSSGT